MDEVENFFYQFPNPWALRVSGMGGYTSKCEKKVKITAPYCTRIQCVKGGGCELWGSVPQTDKHLPHSSLAGSFLLDDDIFGMLL